MLFISINLTIFTVPGYIPEESEWDMPSRLNTEDEDLAEGERRGLSQGEESKGDLGPDGVRGPVTIGK